MPPYERSEFLGIQVQFLVKYTGEMCSSHLSSHDDRLTTDDRILEPISTTTTIIIPFAKIFMSAEKLY